MTYFTSNKVRIFGFPNNVSHRKEGNGGSIKKSLMTEHHHCKLFNYTRIYPKADTKEEMNISIKWPLFCYIAFLVANFHTSLSSQEEQNLLFDGIHLQVKTMVS